MNLRTPFFRIRQWIFSRALRLLEHKTPQLHSGCGSLSHLPELLTADRATRVLLVTTQGFVRRGTAQILSEQLRTAGVSVTLFAKVLPDPDIACVESGVESYRAGSCSAIVALGGGSVMDCAKLIGARISRPGRTIRRMRGYLRIRRRLPPLYAIPTTAGTGSEATAAAVVTDTVNGRHEKYAVADLCLTPRRAILDPELTVGLSAELTATTGMDALTHAIEAYTNHFASRHVRRNATEAVRLIFENLPAACRRGNDLPARTNLLRASYLAGLAFNSNFVGYVHALAHGIGALYGIPHGLANAILLPAVLQEYGKSVEKPLAALADAIGVSGETRTEKADAVKNAIRSLCRELSIPSSVGELKKEDLELLAARALHEANPAYPVPEIFGKEQLLHILNTVLPEAKGAN